MKSIYAALFALGLAACSDTVTSTFPTLTDARNAKAFDRGWLPPLLPNSSKNIVEINNLDLNSGGGSFQYDPAERDSYIQQLLAAHKATLSGSEITVNREDTIWTIKLPEHSNEATYYVRVAESP